MAAEDRSQSFALEVPQPQLLPSARASHPLRLGSTPLQHLSIVLAVGLGAFGQDAAHLRRAVGWLQKSLDDLKESRTLESLSIQVPSDRIGCNFAWDGTFDLASMPALRHVALDMHIKLDDGIALPPGCRLILGARSVAVRDRGCTLTIGQSLPYDQPEGPRSPWLNSQRKHPMSVGWGLANNTAVIITIDGPRAGHSDHQQLSGCSADRLRPI